MRLLLDQNLSHRRIGRLADIFANSVHMREVGLGSADDTAVWDFAKTNNLVLVSKDAVRLEEAPPKIVWLRVGNCTTYDIESVLRHHASDMEAFFNNKDAALLVLDR